MSNPLFFQFHNHPSSGMGFQTSFNSGDLEVHTTKHAALQVKLSDSQLSIAVTPPTPHTALKGIFKPRNPPPLLLHSALPRQKKPQRHESSSSSTAQVHYNEVTDSRKYPGGFNYHDPGRYRRGTGSAGTSRVLASHPEDVYRLGRYESRDLWNLLAQRVQGPESVSTSASDEERGSRMAGYDPRGYYNDARMRPPGAERGYDSYGRYREPRHRVFR